MPVILMTFQRQNDLPRTIAHKRREPESSESDATTTWLKQYLETIIVRCERLADEVEQPEGR